MPIIALGISGVSMLVSGLGLLQYGQGPAVICGTVAMIIGSGCCIAALMFAIEPDDLP